ncbi:centrosomal protein of 55 kDa-like [Stegastes partitus]|uniref:Centrosomal protein of 55 kDa-like n=1 Tax=Stegastes partitus TaxID=144197 RepID=A0A9Y4K0C4_9TELE|nr:PREDICTED: centrosomal protein of 55 kDa-like [Stegastes partitus]
MAASKYKCSLQKKLNSELVMVVSSLKKQDACLKKTLAELSQQHSQHNKLLERFLSLQIERQERCQPVANEENAALPSEQSCKRERNPMDGASAVDEQASTSDQAVTELQNQLRDALEKNKQWLEYDQQREACVRAILARVLWLERQLNEANQALSQQHNEEHSDEKERANQMQEHYEKLLQKAKNEQKVLRESLDMANDNLIITQNWCEEREKEVEDLKQQLQIERMSRESPQEDDHYSEDEEQQLKDETKDLQGRLDEERRRSASFELQANVFQRIMLNRHHADQEDIAELKRQIKISSQDLEDERQDCSYLKKQMIRLLKTLQKTKGHVNVQSKRDQQDHSSCEVMQPPSQPSRDSLASSPLSSSLNESFLECPSCHAEYPASHYRELINHLEICLD